jgi:hypothetical protein
MAAGLGYIEFATGDILTAAAANGYLASQTVMVFASSAARTSAITSPQEGMMSYLKDTNSVEYYSGSAWIAVGGSSTPTFSGVRVFKSSTQSISNATVTDLTFDSETFDTDAFHSTSSNTDRLTVPAGKAGKYLVIAKMSYAGGVNGIRQVFIYKNTTEIEVLTWQNTSNSNADMCLSTIVDLTVGDYVKMATWQNNGGSLNANSGTGYTVFSMEYLGA